MNVTYSKEIVSDAQALKLLTECDHQINALAVYASRTNNTKAWNALTDFWVLFQITQTTFKND